MHRTRYNFDTSVRMPMHRTRYSYDTLARMPMHRRRQDFFRKYLLGIEPPNYNAQR